MLLNLTFELTFDKLHLILEAKFQLLQTDLFQLFVFGEKSFLGEGFKPLRIFRMFVGQLAKLVVIYEELVSRSKHPPDLLTGIRWLTYHRAYAASIPNSINRLSRIAFPTAINCTENHATLDKKRRAAAAS